MPVVDAIVRRGDRGKRVTSGPNALEGPKAGRSRSPFSSITRITGSTDFYEVTNPYGLAPGNYTIYVRPVNRNGLSLDGVGRVAVVKQAGGRDNPNVTAALVALKRLNSVDSPLVLGPFAVTTADRLFVVLERKGVAEVKYQLQLEGPDSALRDELWAKAGAVPSLDLRLATSKSLVDSVSGQNLVTFTRASTGTFVDSDGVIRSATTNLLLRSEEFGNAAWTLTRATISTNAETAPNGTLTADKLVEDGTAANTHQVAQNVAGLASGVAYTASIFIKAAGRTSALVLFSGTPFGAGGGQFFNLLNGTLGNVTGSLDRTATIEAYPNGWYKMSITRTTTASGTGGITVRTAVANSSTTDGDSTSGILIWGAQLEQSSTVGPYIPTTSTINSAPRFDHNPTTGESLGLLVEEQRTNLTPRSEEFNDAAWVKARASITPNDAASPSGAITADKIAEDNTANSTHVAAQVFTFAATTYTLSIFAKAAERSWVRLFAFDETTNFGCYFNLSAGTVGTAAASTGSIIPLADGWFRCVMTFTAAAGTGSYAARLATGDGADTYTGNGTSGLFLWGAQLEAGAFPTSYIPTTASAATRTADVVSITGTNLSSWYRQDEGTWLGQYAPIYNASATVPSGTPHLFQVYTAASQNNLYSIRGAGSTTNQETFGRNPTVGLLFVNNGVGFGVTGLLRKVAMSIDSAFISASTNNGVVATEANTVAALMTAHNILSIGTGTAGVSPQQVNSHIRRLTFWPTRLSNSTLQSITQ